MFAVQMVHDALKKTNTKQLPEHKQTLWVIVPFPWGKGMFVLVGMVTVFSVAIPIGLSSTCSVLPLALSLLLPLLLLNCVRRRSSVDWGMQTRYVESVGTFQLNTMHWFQWESKAPASWFLIEIVLNCVPLHANLKAPVYGEHNNSEYNIMGGICIWITCIGILFMRKWKRSENVSCLLLPRRCREMGTKMRKQTTSVNGFGDSEPETKKPNWWQFVDAPAITEHQQEHLAAHVALYPWENVAVSIVSKNGIYCLLGNMLLEGFLFLCEGKSCYQKFKAASYENVNTVHNWHMTDFNLLK